MPELPEVETICQALKKELCGHTITALEVRVAKLFHGRRNQLIGQKVVEVTRRAKLLIWRLESGFVVFHLKMTGQLLFVPRNQRRPPLVGGHPDKAYLTPPPHQHTHITIQFDHGTLYFNDLRKFGWLKVFARQEELAQELARYGPEYDWPEFSLESFQQTLGRRSRLRIKPALMDQTLIAGLGNIYSDEVLFCAKIRPDRRIIELTSTEIKQLYRCIPAVIALALKHGGTSSRDYRQVDGRLGTYLQVAKVYRRAGQPCRVCATPIERLIIANRSSHYCPRCQPPIAMPHCDRDPLVDRKVSRQY